jgi:MFS transporter, DHA1 family, multidrug resistance protein
MAQDPWPVDWRRNLAVLWFAQFTAIFGFSFAFPFLPIYLQQDLGIADKHALAVWSGVAGAAAGVAQALLSPAWGSLADRFGRKSMLIRAMVGGGVTVGAMAFTQTALQLVGLRFLQGALAGTVAATTTLVATGTPRDRVAFSMGVLSSAVAVGAAAGPFAGGVAAGLLGLRAIFLAGGVLLLFSVLPVILMVREMPMHQAAGTRVALLPALRAAPGVLAVVAALLLAQSLLQVGWSGSQPLVTLKLLNLAPGHAATLTGVAFASAGAASATAAFLVSWLAARAGYKRLTAAAALLAGLSLVLLTLAPNPVLVIVATALSGLFFGALGPAISAMLGLEAPAAVQGRVFGLSASATAFGFGVGPLMAGLIAGLVSLPVALLFTAAVAVLLAMEMALFAREPAR